jgi:hypothetical protein
MNNPLDASFRDVNANLKRILHKSCGLIRRTLTSRPQLAMAMTFIRYNH